MTEMAFDIAAWLTDPAVTRCTPATRGIWMDLIGVMHLEGRVAQLRGTAEELARFARCLPAEMVQALTELRTHGTADVEHRNGVYIVTCRRMQREATAREAGRCRVERHRGVKRRCNGDVTQASPIPPTPPDRSIDQIQNQSINQSGEVQEGAEPNQPLTAEPHEVAWVVEHIPGARYPDRYVIAMKRKGEPPGGYPWDRTPEAKAQAKQARAAKADETLREQYRRNGWMTRNLPRPPHAMTATDYIAWYVATYGEPDDVEKQIGLVGIRDGRIDPPPPKE